MFYVKIVKQGQGQSVGFSDFDRAIERFYSANIKACDRVELYSDSFLLGSISDHSGVRFHNIVNLQELASGQ